MAIEGDREALSTSTVAETDAPLRLRAVTPMTCVPATSGIESTTNVPVVSLCCLAKAVNDEVPALAAIVAGSTLAHVPLTSIAVAPVRVAGSGEVIARSGAAPKYFTRTLVIAIRPDDVRARARRTFSPLVNGTSATVKECVGAPSSGMVNGRPLTSPLTTPAPTV